jgi:DNA-binding response OmpR family regulator
MAIEDQAPTTKVPPRSVKPPGRPQAARSDRILWVDDEVDLLKPHLMLLRNEGYAVDAIMNGNDALELLRRETYDLVLLDEQMPGLRGIDVLKELRQRAPRLPVVMVTKSEADSTMHEAIGRRADDYIVKPTSPRQVLSVVTRLLAGPALRHEQISRDFARRFGELREKVSRATTWRDWAELYSEMVDWELRLDESNERGLKEILESLITDLRRGYCDLVVDRYEDWVHEGGERGPILSVDVLNRFLRPVLEDESTLLIIMDCMRLDQWRAIVPQISEYFEVEETLYASILPTATPFSRNAIFSGLFPDELAERYEEWWGGSEEKAGYNWFEDELLHDHIEELAGAPVRTHYEKIFSSEESGAMLGRLAGYLSAASVTALVFGFVDLLTHGRSESKLLWEIARDSSALRRLTVTWFERSAAFEALRQAARQGVRVLFTTDHGSLHCHRPATVCRESVRGSGQSGRGRSAPAARRYEDQLSHLP